MCRERHYTRRGLANCTSPVLRAESTCCYEMVAAQAESIERRGPVAVFVESSPGPFNAVDPPLPPLGVFGDAVKAAFVVPATV